MAEQARLCRKMHPPTFVHYSELEDVRHKLADVLHTSAEKLDDHGLPQQDAQQGMQSQR